MTLEKFDVPPTAHAPLKQWFYLLLKLFRQKNAFDHISHVSLPVNDHSQRQRLTRIVKGLRFLCAQCDRVHFRSAGGDLGLRADTLFNRAVRRRRLHHVRLLVHGIDLVCQSGGHAGARGERYFCRHPAKRCAWLYYRATARCRYGDDAFSLAHPFLATRCRARCCASLRNN